MIDKKSSGLTDPKNKKSPDKWQDHSFVSEMETRYEHYKNGGKLVSVAEAEERIKAIIHKSKAQAP